MTAEIIRPTFPTNDNDSTRPNLLMVCTVCGGHIWAIHSDGVIQCAGCEAYHMTANAVFDA